MLLDPTEATSFWSKIWSEGVGHSERASWLEDVEVEFSSTEVQKDISITVEDIRNGVSKMANWKAAGPDLVQGFWFKKLTLRIALLTVRMLARLYMSRECTRVDGQGKNSFDTKGHSEECPGQQLPPYCLPTHDVEAIDRSYGREVIPRLGKEWTDNR